MKKIIVLFFIFVNLILAAEKSSIELTKPAKKIGLDLWPALYQRKSSTEFIDKKIELDKLGAILWAANGVNREDGKRTAPSAFNSQFINIYVATDEAVYLYDGQGQALNFIVSGNIKDKIGIQSFVKTAPVVLIMTASLKKLPVYAGRKSTRLNAAYANTGCIAQNIYLAAAALNLGTRYVMFVNEKGIKYFLKLDKNEMPICIMPLGYLK